MIYKKKVHRTEKYSVTKYHNDITKSLLGFVIPHQTNAGLKDVLTQPIGPTFKDQESKNLIYDHSLTNSPEGRSSLVF